MPVYLIPFHLSYLLYLNSFSEALMNVYLGMAIPSDRKVSIFTNVIQRLSKHFELVNMSTHAESIS